MGGGGRDRRFVLWGASRARVCPRLVSGPRQECVHVVIRLIRCE